MLQIDAFKRIATNKQFDHLAVAVIVINAVLIGVELSHRSRTLDLVQNSILAFFVAELAFRFIGRESTKDYLSDGWNYFDVIIVAISLVPEEAFGGANVSVLRALRVFRIFRALRTVEELRLITSVLLRSIRSLFYSGLLFLIFMYVYAVIGVGLFKNENYSATPNAELNPTNPDPYGSLGEAMFSLFRILTGEDWTDLRYNLVAIDPGTDAIVTIYHVSWMVISAFLLINLVIGAVVNNYDLTMEEVRQERSATSTADAAAGSDEEPTS